MVNAQRRFVVAEPVHPTLMERLEKAEETPSLKRIGLVGAAIIALVVIAAWTIAHFAGWPHF